MGKRRMSRNLKIALLIAALIVLALLAGKCAYSAGEWIGSH